MKKTYVVRNLVIIIASLTLVVGSISLLGNISPKIIHTFANLVSISDSINFANEQSRNTDEMSVTISNLMAERESLYQSSDWIVSTYSNLGTVTILGDILQIVVLVLALSMYPLIFIMWLFLVINSKTIVRRIKRKRLITK